MSSPFFVNGRGKALARLQNTAGSYLHRVAMAVGIPNLSTTDLRRSVEGVIQTSSDMKKNAKHLNMHSDQVGKQIYDVSKFTVRPEWVNHVEHLEGSAQEKKEERDLSESDKARLGRMQELEMEDAITRRHNAQKFLTEERKMKGKNVPLGPRCRVNAIDRTFLQNLVLEKVFKSAKNPQFPRGLLLCFKWSTKLVFRCDSISSICVEKQSVCQHLSK